MDVGERSSVPASEFALNVHGKQLSVPGQGNLKLANFSESISCTLRQVVDILNSRFPSPLFGGVQVGILQ